MFIDRATITVKAGKGGDGCVSFHREKYINAGGPDGGDGGRGGHVIVEVDNQLSTLLDFRYKRKYSAANGDNGRGKRCSGKNGANLTIRVPRGTLLYEKESSRLIADMSDEKPVVLALGGRGGWGNAHFASPTRQTPHFAKSGLAGQETEIILELKLLADACLIGFPNAGKSSILSVISAARPKIADYHFTTLTPNLGVVYVDRERSFVCADIPGLIDGASEGAGLGHEFLRHIERCRLLIHVVDISGFEGRDPCVDYDIIRRQLSAYSPELAKRPEIIAANKSDIMPADSDALERLTAHVSPVPVLLTSAAASRGMTGLINLVYSELQNLPPVKIFQPDFVPVKREFKRETDITKDGKIWIAKGEWLTRLLADINLTDYESRMYFERCLRTNGLFGSLEKMGIEEGDIIRIDTTEFEYVR